MKTFKEKLESMSGADVLEAMINGLKKAHVKVDMGTYGSRVRNICFGCAATNTICEIEGRVFGAIDIWDRAQRALFLGIDEADSPILSRFLYWFEDGIDDLRSGHILDYNYRMKQLNLPNLCIVNEEYIELPELRTQNYLENLWPYEQLLLNLREKENGKN